MDMGGTVMIEGRWFISLNYHDGRFARGAGRFAFSRRDADGGRTIFCLEEAQDISRVAGPDHQIWSHAISQGMNEVLVHLSAARAPLVPEGARIEAPPLRFDFPQTGDSDGVVVAFEGRAA